MTELAAEVDEVDGGERLAEEGGAEALELFYGVCGVEGAVGEGGCGCFCFELRAEVRVTGVSECLHDSICGGVGGIDDEGGGVEVAKGSAEGGAG